MKLKAALIGCGRIGSEMADDARIKGIITHAAAYRACPKIDFVAVCDTDLEKANRCAARWNVPSVYTEIPDLLAGQRPEIVSICTPDASHADVLEKVLRSNGVRAVWAEKPLALDVDRARTLVDLAEAGGIVLAVNYPRRYSVVHAKVRDLVRSGGIGTIQKVSGLYSKGILHNGTHWFDLARWVVGEIRKVRAFGGGSDPGVDPTLDAALHFDNGAAGALMGCDAEAFSVFEMDIIGTRGRVRLLDSGHRVEIHRVGDSPHYSGYLSLRKDEEQVGEVESTGLAALEDLVRSLETGTPPRCTGLDGLAALRIASAVVTSAREGSEIDLGSFGR
jgi:predicted dehydrogenase